MAGPSSTNNIKFLCSYGGKILPRHPDGKLRYYGGETRVLSVDRSISFSELLVKLGEMYGASVSLRCQLPAEDLDALVSITSDEDLANLIEEYDRCGSIKIRAFLSPPKSTKKGSPPLLSTASSSTSSSSMSPRLPYTAPRFLASSRGGKCIHQMSRLSVMSPCYEKRGGKPPQYAHHLCPGNTGHIYLIHHGNYWQ
nr:Octicosapeptide/Phox/Bem1p family protein isoform 1 [Ipomoea batatas]